MQKIKAVIFDIDGTLANSVPLCVQAFRQALEPQLHRPMSDEEIQAAFGPDEKGTIQSFNPPDVQKATDYFMRYYQNLHEELCPEPFDGIKDLLKNLKTKTFTSPLLREKEKIAVKFRSQRFGIFQYFGKIENGAPEGSRKPEAIQNIVEAFGVPKAAILYVGDSEGDIKESHKAGIPVVAAAWAETADKEKLKKQQPDAIFDSVQGFATWLEQRIEVLPAQASC